MIERRGRDNLSGSRILKCFSVDTVILDLCAALKALVFFLMKPRKLVNKLVIVTEALGGDFELTGWNEQLTARGTFCDCS